MKSNLKKVTVITGGAGGMGLAAAKLLGKDNHIVIADVNQQRLDSAIAELSTLGISCHAAVCDITNPENVHALFKQAQESGVISSVIHTAGISPQMADPQAILKVNALGTINITEAALAIAADGFVLVNVASMAGYFLPALLVPSRAYRYAFTNTPLFLKKLLFLCRLIPSDFYRKGMAYSLSKNFVSWYSKQNAARFGAKGARVISVSPGSFDTDMGRLEEKSGSAEMLKHAALKRFGRPEEIAELLAFCASDKAGYLTGIDILCDGGVVAGYRGRKA
ncbi:MAG: SDR family oxidoreductase, partial [Pseudomonadales bacterium]|nr:SDR family oxidoreductase [Pseudomonadales bacterium]